MKNSIVAHTVKHYSVKKQIKKNLIYQINDQEVTLFFWPVLCPNPFSQT